MTQIVPKYDEAAVLEAWRHAAEEDWESDGNEEIQPSFPVIKIVQGTSTMPEAEKHVGEFYHSDLEAYTPVVECVGLVKRDTRAYFQEGNDQPVCMSPDGAAPLPNQPLWEGKDQPEVCDECPFSDWQDNGDPPLCRASMVVLVDRGDGDLAQLRIGGKSIRPYRNFVARKLRPKKLPLYSQRLMLSTEMKSEPGKKWAELVIESQTMTPTEALRYNHILQDQRHRFEESIAAEGGRVESWVEDDKADDLPFE